jgi:hypothetical protein
MKVAFFIDSSPVGGGYYHMMNFVNLALSSTPAAFFISANGLINKVNYTKN